jgi:hypothetical protein
MPGIASSSNLSELLQRLASEKARHEQSTAAVSGTLEEISGLLGSLLGGTSTSSSSVSAPRPALRGRPRKAASTPAAAAPVKATRGRRKRAKFAMSGEETVLAFVRQNRNPSTSEIQAHWKSEGRGSSADNSLSKLVKDKKLKREPNKQGKGSRYVLA